MVPDYRAGNPYQQLLAKELEVQGTVVEFDKYPFGFFPLLQLLRKHKRIDILHVHWIAELLRQATWAESSLIYRAKCLLMIVECWLIRLIGKKIIWTIHNKFAHEQYNRDRELLFRKCLAKGASRIIVHSKEALEQLERLYGMPLSYKTDVIFHGNYSSCYPDISETKIALRKKLSIPKDVIVVGYFGMIRTYKGVETLIQAFNEMNTNTDIFLLIAGKVETEDYVKTLTNSVDSKNVRLIFEFLSDQDLVNYISVADVVCLPFSDSLTSGSTILAMCCNKALLLPQNAQVFGCVPDNGVHYFHTQQQLKETIENLHLEELQIMGDINFRASSNMTWEKVAQKTNTAYFN
jgi:beta-1,4-mannosyltransferase